MPTDNDDTIIKERFAELPPVVQAAIVSADVQNHLRELAKKHNLHLDQWGDLEDQVQMTLMGIEDSNELTNNIEKNVGVAHDIALALAQDISTIVFEPIRQELERQLDHPDAVAVAKTGVEQMRDRVLQDSVPVTAAQPSAEQTPTQTPSPTSASAEPAAATPSAQSVIDSSIAPVAPIVAATPPTPAPIVTIERTNPTPGYTPSVPSHERKAIEGDPYREPIA